MTDPKVSVVMPVYNSETYLEAATRSILAQTFTDFELIAVDDGSTDASARLLDRLATEDSRLTIVHQDNGGVTKALNTGLAAARGLYVARMDSDDLAWPERFARQVAALDTRPDVVAIGTQFRLIDPEGRPLNTLPVPCDHASLDDRLMREQSLSLCHPSVMFRKTALDQIGGYSDRFLWAEDIDMFLRLAEIGTLANLETVLMDYRMHLGSVGYTRRAEQAHNAWAAGQAAAARRGVAFDIPAPVPAPHAERKDDVWRLWGWRALRGGNVSTARHYARRAVLQNPWSRQNWWLALMALRGR